MEKGKLPEEFLDRMKRLLGGEYESYLKSFEEEPLNGLRVNTMKISTEDFRKRAEEAGWDLEPVPWISNGFYYGGDLRPARHPDYFAGLYYLQEPSAMTPASLLPVEPGEKVLDLCAAPGGKSTELAAKLQGKGMLFSNDISNSRARALLKNLELFGTANLCVSSETPEKLSRTFGGYFDKILVDAPCSGEGMFRRDPDMVKSYEEKGPEYYVPIQREILSAAVSMLAPGGMLLYSTCTFDREEDEGNILHLLEEHPELHPVRPCRRPEFSEGIGLPECVRLFPHRVAGEGHFIALLKKDGVREESREAAAGNPVRTAPSQQRGRKKAEADPAEAVLAFLKKLPSLYHPERLYLAGEQAFLLPEPIAGQRERFLKGIRYLRTGLYLGDVKRGRFEPSQPLAMALRAEEYENQLNLEPGDARTVRYLKGETLSLTEKEQSLLEKQKEEFPWCLVCTDRYPLGWGRYQNGTLKNKYYAGWRWQ